METLRELFDVGTVVPKARHVSWRDASGAFRYLTTPDVRSHVASLGRSLAALGLRKGDRLALLARNSPRWALSDYAFVTTGLVTVPLYPSLAPDQVRFVIDDSGARMLFLEDQEQLERLAPALAGSRLEAVVLLEGEAPAVAPAGLPRLLSWSRLSCRDGDGVLLDVAIAPPDLASLIYTSGTTGPPKGVMLTHGNLVSNALACEQAVALSTIEHVNLSLLPLCHVFQRLVDYFLFMRRATMVYCPNPLDAMAWFTVVRPTFFASVPRLYEKIHSGFVARVQKQSAPMRWLVTWALAVGRERHETWCRGGACDGKPSWWLSARHAVADALVLRRVRALFGGRVDQCFSGGAPIATETALFLRAAGLPLLPGYGLTESSPVLCTNRPARLLLGTVGPALPGVDLRLGPDGELLARGPNIMQGYWNRPDDTAAALEGGWLHTGDLARVDERGYVSITGRKKEILVLSTGKKVQPALVEDALARAPLVSQAVVIGDGQKFVGALIVPKVPALVAEARRAGVTFASEAALVAGADAQRLVQRAVDEACAPLSEFERPKAVALLPRELSAAHGELTPTLKVRRKEVLANWKDVVDAMFRSGKGDGG